MTDIQFNILAYLMANEGRVMSSDQILKRVWGEDYLGDNHLVQVNIACLRRKLREDNGSRIIETRTGIGYLIKNNRVEIERILLNPPSEL